MDCPLCALPPEHVIWEDDRCRVIRVDDPAHPGFCRVVWGEHVAEMTDLSPADRSHLFAVVMATEAALRTLLPPDKINLASFGNMVPHLRADGTFIVGHSETLTGITDELSALRPTLYCRPSANALLERHRLNRAAPRALHPNRSEHGR